MSDNKKIPITKDDRLEEFLNKPEVLKIIELVRKDLSNKPKGDTRHKPIIISPAKDLYE